MAALLHRTSSCIHVKGGCTLDNMVNARACVCVVIASCCSYDFSERLHCCCHLSTTLSHNMYPLYLTRCWEMHQVAHSPGAVTNTCADLSHTASWSVQQFRRTHGCDQHRPHNPDAAQYYRSATFILRQSYDYLTMMPKLRSTYDGRLIYKTSYEECKAVLRYDSLAKS